MYQEIEQLNKQEHDVSQLHILWITYTKYDYTAIFFPPMFIPNAVQILFVQG